ncbi:MAG: hypothetical protein KDA80_24075 [Planctomycetaceae bacterium]|nr:hypothetical protein [Planctomycetaceae bacterium]
MREVVRRMAFAVCLYSGIALCLTPGHGLSQLRPVDWAQEAAQRQRHTEQIKSMMGAILGQNLVEEIDLAEDTRGDLENFISARTEGRLVVMSGPEWEGLWNDIAATVQDAAPSVAWEECRGVESQRGSVYLPTSRGPLGQIRDVWPTGSHQVYVRIDPVDDQLPPRYLGVTECGPSELRDGAPTHIAYPYRTVGAVLLLGGLLFFIILHRRPVPSSGLFYQARAAGWLPDFLAAFGSGAFFAMPFLIAGDTADGPLSWEWWPITTVLWGMATLFASLFVITTWYQTRRLIWSSDGLSIETWGGSPRYYAADEIQSVTPATVEMPDWLKTLAGLIALFNWRAAPSTMLLEQSDPGFSLLTRDGQSWRFPGDGLYGANGLLRWLDGHRIPVAPSVRELMQEKFDYEPGIAGRIVGGIFAILVLSVSGPFLLIAAGRAMPRPEPEYRVGSFHSSTGFQVPQTSPTNFDALAPLSIPVQQKPEELVEDLMEQRRILKEIEQVREELDSLKSQIGTVSNPNAVAIERVQKVMQQLKGLQDQLDAIGQEEVREYFGTNSNGKELSPNRSIDTQESTTP